MDELCESITPGYLMRTFEVDISNALPSGNPALYDVDNNANLFKQVAESEK